MSHTEPAKPSTAPAAAEPVVVSVPAPDLEEVRALAKADRRLEALRKLEPLLKQFPSSIEAWALRASLLVAHGELDAARVSLERAEEIDVDDVGAWKLMATCWCDLRKADRALRCAERLARLAPIDSEANRLRGRCLVLSMRHAEGITAYEKAVLHAPDDVEAWFEMGRTLRQLRRSAEARYALTKAAELADASRPDIARGALDLLERLAAADQESGSPASKG